jgi:radical SAM protein with 4Fe4S-binding SPASM domain
MNAHQLKLLASYLRECCVCPGLPPTGIIATTHRCNMNCRMCIRAKRAFTGPDMAFDLFKAIIDEWTPDLRYLSMDGPGETIMNPEAFDMIRYAKSRQIRVMFSTNATLLDGDMADEILHSGLDLIIFSVNGASSEVYRSVHGCDCYREAVANIHRFLERKRARRSKIIVAVQMIRLPETMAETAAFVRIWRRVPGVNIIRVKKDVVCHEGECLSEPMRSKPRRNPCSRLWHGPPHIEPNGDVYASPGILFRANPVGNLKDQSLAQIWNGERMQAMRRAHISGNLSEFPECNDCCYPKPRLPLILAGFLVSPFVAGNLIPLTEKLAFRCRIPLYQ